MDSFEFNKIAGGILAAMLTAMVIGIIGDSIVPDHHAEGDPVYMVAVPESEEPTEEEAGEEMAAPSVLAMLADADLDAGEGVTKKCAACHSFDNGGPTKIGPNLWDIVNKPIANVADYAYSDALAGYGGDWNYENLDAFLANPKEFAPGTKMSFGGLKKIEDRANLIAWLRIQSPSPAALPVVEETPAAEEEMSAAEEAIETVETAAEAAMEAAESTATAAAEAVEEAAEEAAEAVEGAVEEAATAVESATGAAGESVMPLSPETAPTEPEAASAESEAAPAESEAAAVEPEAAPDEPEAAPAEPETAAAEPETVVASDFGTKLANADLAAGETMAKKCVACHNIAEGMGKKIGPNLWDIVGRPVASNEGFKYSDAITEFGGDWTFERLDDFLEAPKSVVPGTKMGSPGIKDPQDRINLIAWLRMQSGNPQPLP